MNYFAHGCRFVERPYFLMGTAIPDMIRVSDPGVRVRSKKVLSFAGGTNSPEDEVAAGILQHLEDDDRFHGSVAFIQLSAQLSQFFRKSMPDDDGMRPSFLGHIVTELILDAILIERAPEILSAYYRAFQQIDPVQVQFAVNRVATSPATRLAQFIPLFHQEQFLWDYRQPTGMLHRLNQVMRRVKLAPLPVSVEGNLREIWPLVAAQADNLLPFVWTTSEPNA